MKTRRRSAFAISPFAVMAFGVVLVLLALFAGATSRFATVRAATSAEDQTDTQLAALRRLEQASQRPIYIRFDRGVPRFVDVQIPAPEGVPVEPVAQALNFLNTYRDLYRLQDPTAQLYLRRTLTDQAARIPSSVSVRPTTRRSMSPNSRFTCATETYSARTVFTYPTSPPKNSPTLCSLRRLPSPSHSSTPAA